MEQLRETWDVEA